MPEGLDAWFVLLGAMLGSGGVVAVIDRAIGIGQLRRDVSELRQKYEDTHRRTKRNESLLLLLVRHQIGKDKALGDDLKLHDPKLYRLVVEGNGG